MSAALSLVWLTGILGLASLFVGVIAWCDR